MENLQVILSVSLPTLAVLVGMFINNPRLSDLRAHVDTGFAHMDKGFAALENLFNQRLLRVERLIDARLTRIGRDLEEMRS